MRLFTFGCSFTNFHWPTWADIMAHDLQCEYQNWAVNAIGNVAIQHKLLECDLKHKFTDDDLVLVVWSGWSREDRYFGEWVQGGNIFSLPDKNKEWIKKYWHIENDIVKNMSAIITANKNHRITHQSHIFDYDFYLNEKEKQPNKQVLKTLKKFDYLIEAMPEKHVFSRQNNSQFLGTTWDEHPDILCHLEYANYIYSKLGMTMKQSTVEYYTKMFYDIVEKFKKEKRKTKITDWLVLEKVITKIVKEWYSENQR